MLELHNIEKAFAGQPVLQGVSLTIEQGEVVVLLGPSGSGKTTLLRLIAGLERPDSGRLRLDGQDLTPVPIHQRGFGMVFQEYALFPHKNVLQNVAFGLRMLRWDQARITERVAQVLRLVGLAGFAERPIHDLSGGEQQRVALARALAPAPRLLLLDEPLGALDRALRERLMLELRAILKETGGIVSQPEGITAVYVTHDQAEAFAVADRVAVMNEGRIVQVGSPMALYRRPATPFVARFLGMENLFAGRVISSTPCILLTALGEVTVADDRCRQGDVTLLIRPEAGRLLEEGRENLANVVKGQITNISFRGRYQIVTFALPRPHFLPAAPIPSLKLEFDATLSLPPPGTSISLRLAPESLILLESG
jgi:ABC-type Fe3+/spermidine/putrescine transport system ATPase subunit